jgi:metal-responsive CopG/Arc/MetJ family transcriptional regulator
MQRQKKSRRPSAVNPSPPERDVYLPQVAVRFPYEVVRELDEFAAESGGRFNRSDLIREGVDLYLPILREKRRKKNGDNH